MPRVVHFEIHAENPDRAITFYKAMFDWTFTAWGGGDYWLIVTGPDGTPGINGGLIRRRGPAPTEGQAVNAYVCTVDVPDVDEYVARATAHGAVVALPKMPIPSVGWLAYVKDTEGNILGLYKLDPTAK